MTRKTSARNERFAIPRLMLRRRMNAWAALCVVGSGIMMAQSTPDTMPQRGIVPAGSYTISDIETINSVNGNLMYRIPLATLPPGNAGWTADVSLIYNSQIYDITLSTGNSIADPTTPVLYQTLTGSPWGDWRYSYSYGIVLETRPSPQLNGSYNCYTSEENWKIYKLKVITPDGSYHTLHLYPNTPSVPAGFAYWDIDGDGYFAIKPDGKGSGCPFVSPATGDLTYYTTDGTYMKVVFSGSNNTYWTSRPWTIYFGDGRTASGHGSQMETMSDRNGNTISVSNTTSGGITVGTTLSDSAGRSISIQYGTSDTISQSGFAEGGSPRTLTTTVHWTSVPLGGSNLTYPCSPLDSCAGPSGETVVSSVVLPTTPDGTVPQYSFGYSGTATGGWGELNDVTLPSGANVHYSYYNETHVKVLGQAAENPLLQKTLKWTDEADSSVRTETTSYSFYETSSVITQPDGGVVTNWFDSRHGTSPTTGLVFKTTMPDGSTSEKTWYLNRPYGSQSADSANPYVKYQFQSTAKNGAPEYANVRTYSIDKNGNQVAVSEYDWFPYSAITHDSEGAPTGYAGTLAAVRSTSNTYNVTTVTAGAGGEAITDQSSAYWNPGSLNSSGPTTWSLLKTATTGSVQATYDYGDSSGHPNLVTEKHLDNQTGTWLTTTYGYDTHGNQTSVTNPRGYQTRSLYDSSACMYQRVLAYGTARARTFNYVCDPNMGKTTSVTDADHSIATTYDYDRFGRFTLATQSGGGLSRKTKTEYSDGTRKISVKRDLNAVGDAALVQSIWYDQLGRARQSTDEAGSTTQSRYYTPTSGSGGSYELQSTPYVSTSDSTMGWTRTKRDTNGRVVEVAHFSGAALPSPWGSNSSTSGAATTSYSSTTTTSIDESGVSRTTAVDGLGRMSQVAEAGIPTATTYGYDVLGNLTTVTQGDQSRSFTYSTVGRLTSAINPESGTTSYTYDANGNVQTRVQAGSTTTYAYDELDQLTGKTYSDSTPVVSYGYDHGWRTSALSGNTLVAYTLFDGFGRTKVVEQTTNGVIYKTQYSYNLADGVTSMILPSGRSVTTTFNSAGRPSTVQGAVNSQNSNYVTSVTYASHGAPKAIAFGNGITETTDYNPRLQPTSIAVGSLMTLSYAYTPAGSTNNNGNVRSHTVSTGGKTYVQTFTYDALNRLSTAAETTGNATTWSQGYGYDRYGNRWVSAEAPSGLSTAFTPVASSNFDGNNRMIKNSATYDSGGRQSAIGGYGFGYDAENRLTWSTMNSATTSFSYDADGRRVAKSAPSGNSTYVYGVSGELVAEYSTTANPVSGVEYLTIDSIGSTRLVTNGSGTVLGCHDYLPFGEEIVQTLGARPTCYSANDGIRNKFTGKERDAETGLDFVGARYLASAQGRFISPDPLYITSQKIRWPQQWNLYTYAANNPLRFTDPDGREVRLVCQGDKKEENCANVVADLNDRQGAAFQTKLGDNGVLQVVDADKVDVNKLSASEATLFNVLQDANHTATLEVVGASDFVHFGSFEGAGLNRIDASDLRLLAGSSRQAAGEVVAHEAIEAYSSLSQGHEMDYRFNHAYSDQFFGGVTHPDRASCSVCKPAWNIRTWDFGRIGQALQVKTIETPVPDASQYVYLPGKITEIKKGEK